MSQGNAQVQKDEHMDFSSGFDLNIEDLNSYFNTDVFQYAQDTVQIVKETSETEDQNVQSDCNSECSRNI
jgi:hypothetical protein